MRLTSAPKQQFLQSAKTNMINHSKLERNLEALKKSLPPKPKAYTPDYPVTIAEALTKYANQKTVNLFGINVYNYTDHGWPVPLYINSQHIKVGFTNNIFNRKMKAETNKAFRRLSPDKKFKKVTFWNAKSNVWDCIGIPIMRNILRKDSVDKGVMEMFAANKSMVKNKFLSHAYLQGRQAQINEIFSAYRHQHWNACINSIFPLLDHVARQVLNSQRLQTDIQGLCKLFRFAGIDEKETDVFMAPTNAVMVWDKVRNGKMSKEEGEALQAKGYQHHLYLIGPALSSFLQFSNRYYGHYTTPADPGDPLNRHAIVHGSYSTFASHANVVRLLTYLYLTLELKPVFDILFKE
jgi:hypothetical protein